MKVLLDPAEEQFDLPAVLVEGGDGRGRESEVVGQEAEVRLFGVEDADPAKPFGIERGRSYSGQSDRLVETKALGTVNGVRVEAAELQVAAGADDKEGLALMEPIQPPEADISPVQDIEGAWLGDNVIEDEDIMDASVGDPDKGRDGAA